MDRPAQSQNRRKIMRSIRKTPPERNIRELYYDIAEIYDSVQGDDVWDDGLVAEQSNRLYKRLNQFFLKTIDKSL